MLLGFTSVEMAMYAYNYTICLHVRTLISLFEKSIFQPENLKCEPLIIEIFDKFSIILIPRKMIDQFVVSLPVFLYILN